MKTLFVKAVRAPCDVKAAIPGGLAAGKPVYRCENPTDGYIGRIHCFMPIQPASESPFFAVRGALYASGVKIPFSVTSIVQRISCSSTGTSGDMSCSRQMSTVGQWSCGSRRS